MARRCIFCGTDKPLSNEDILSEWISRELKRGIKVPIRFETVTRVPGKGPGRPFPSSLLAMKAKVVCKGKGGCNNGWMSDLDAEAGAIASRMLWGHKRRLTLNKQHVLAAWITMKLMVAEYAWPGVQATYFTPAERDAMRRERVLPNQTYVWLGFYQEAGTSPAWVGHRHLRFSIEGQPGRTVPGYAAAFVVGRIVGLLLSHRFTPQDGARVGLPVDREFPNATIQIWPSQRVVKWPPTEYAMDETSLQEILAYWESSPVELHPRP